MKPTKQYVEVRNGGSYLGGTRLGLDVVIYEFRDDRSAEEMMERFERGRRELSVKQP